MLEKFLCLHGLWYKMSRAGSDEEHYGDQRAYRAYSLQHETPVQTFLSFPCFLLYNITQQGGRQHRVPAYVRRSTAGFQCNVRLQARSFTSYDMSQSHLY